MDGRGRIARAVVGDRRQLELLEIGVLPEPEIKLHLCCAVPRRQKLDALLKQAAELGAWSIRPLLCEHSVAEGGGRDRWEALLREGCKQSGNPFMPDLSGGRLEGGASEFARRGSDGLLRELSAARVGGWFGRPAFLVGPRGGFSPAELESSGLTAASAQSGPAHLRLKTRRSAVWRVCGWLGVLVAVLCLWGCGNSNTPSHPLMLKGDRYRAEGDGEMARKIYTRLAAIRPGAPEPHLALGTVSDELLNDPAAAYYHYREYLRLAPPEAPDRAAAATYLTMARAKLKRELERENLPPPPPDLMEDNAAMKVQIEQLKRQIFAQQNYIKTVRSRKR